MKEHEMQKEINEKEIKEILKKAKNSGTWESQYLLKLYTTSRCSCAFDEREDFQLLHGDIEVFDLSNEIDEFGRTIEYLIIPKAIPTVIKWFRDYSDINNNNERIEVIFVFTKEGWKSVKVR